MLPIEEHQDRVDDYGYALKGHKLLVHESGLLTLCKRCHNRLTAIRKNETEILGVIRPITREGEEHMSTFTLKPFNIFELWRIYGEKLPFKVIASHWSNPESYLLVEEIEIEKWPYGNASGKYYDSKKQEFQDSGPISSAGSYNWNFFIDKQDDEKGELWSGDYLVAKKNTEDNEWILYPNNQL